MTEYDQIKKRAFYIAIFVSLILTVFKLTSGYITNTWSVVTMGMDSFMDILFTNFNFLMLRVSDTPADKNHPAGHGKFESFAVVIQSVIIFLLGNFMMYKGISDFYNDIHPVFSPFVIGVMGFSVLGSIVISYNLRKAGKLTNSDALIADSAHYTVDIVSNGAIMLGLLGGYIWGLDHADAILNSVFSVMIIISSIKLFIPAFKILTDYKVPDEIFLQFKSIMDNNRDIKGYHSLFVVRNGSFLLFSVHIELDKNMSLYDSHLIADDLEKKIKLEILNSKPTIHVDPV
ncbi:MAG: cation transporter [Candidatus Delongbacteria bacterium]|nr:cation transporter [Candidatus Delongbacteria bacterium]MBN2837109.1 cation transporter [Candidatus Delongbacteria bacterium]